MILIEREFLKRGVAPQPVRSRGEKIMLAVFAEAFPCRRRGPVAMGKPDLR
jgi:hypothetical protein